MKPTSDGQKRRLPATWVRRVVVALIVIGLYVLFGSYQSAGTAAGAAPPLQSVTLTGENFDLEQLEGKAALVHFWASWCGACRMMEASVAEVAGDADLQVITVAVRSGPAPTVRAYLEEAALMMPAIADSSGVLANRFGVTALPTSFYLNENGEVVTTTVGMTSAWGMRLRLWWAGP